MGAESSGADDGRTKHREWRELEEYLGADFEPSLCEAPELRLAEEYLAAQSIDGFYKTSRVYLYDLAAFAASGLKDPLRAIISILAPPGSALLDYGCGSGSDGLYFLEQGYRVAFADFANPSVSYLRWRLARRGLSVPVSNLRIEQPERCDLAYAFDVLEHVDSPSDVLNSLAERARVVVVNFVTTPEAEKHRFPMHRNHDWDGLLTEIAGKHNLVASFELSPTSWYRIVAFRTAGSRPLSLAREWLTSKLHWVPLRWREGALKVLPQLLQPKLRRVWFR